MANGTSVDLSNEDSFSSALQLGEPIYCYARKVPTSTIDGKVVSFRAEHVWKGRKAKALAALVKRKGDGRGGGGLLPKSVCAAAEEAMAVAEGGGEDGGKGRKTVPLPSAATESNVTGRVAELPSGQHGIIELPSSGEKCLFPRSRVFIKGEKLKGRDFLHNYFKVRETISGLACLPGALGGLEKISVRLRETFSSPFPPLPLLMLPRLSCSTLFCLPCPPFGTFPSCSLPPSFSLPSVASRIKIQMIFAPTAPLAAAVVTFLMKAAALTNCPLGKVFINFLISNPDWRRTFV